MKEVIEILNQTSPLRVTLYLFVSSILVVSLSVIVGEVIKSFFGIFKRSKTQKNEG
jgi:hypothetical protein